jgi:hypothetical protein
MKPCSRSSGVPGVALCRARWVGCGEIRGYVPRATFDGMEVRDAVQGDELVERHLRARTPARDKNNPPLALKADGFLAKQSEFAAKVPVPVISYPRRNRPNGGRNGLSTDCV